MPEVYAERRGATQISDTADVPRGTLVTVPSTCPTGSSGAAPVVAVNTVVWYKYPGFMSAIGGVLLALASPVVDAITASEFHWRPLAVGCILAIVAYFRNSANTVI